ncbi:MAG: hypothetical protein Q7V15_06955 [Phenylobacterium sp.]|uniref:hypothetical protein n=1 Tax=Phenylobacterium sp. TaxID=1871053 RepID=UPI00271795B5|nr:hypothetical protein [Phenylobacterium sp.]MDO8901075.1 hypothetical protein [Phenylobacterium sp.]MDP2215446.1 hypothetical protein [Phenylobacterium sp.]
MWPRFGRPRHTGIPAEAVDPIAVGPRDVERAYEQGLLEGQRAERRRRSHPIRNLLIGVFALAGGAVLGVAAWYGSFGKGGEVVDQKLAVAADRAEPTLRAAADEAGAVISGAGRDQQGSSTPTAPLDGEAPAVIPPEQNL